MSVSCVVRIGCSLLLLAPICWAGTEAPVAVSPGTVTGAVIGDVCPTFSWGAIAGAKSYELVVYRIGEAAEEAEPVLAEHISGAALAWTPSLDRGLERGGRYAWSVRAQAAKEASAWSQPSLFEVASGPSEAEFELALSVVRGYLAAQGANATQPTARTDTQEESRLKLSTDPPVPLAPPPGTQLSVDGNLDATSFSGSGAALTALDPANLSTGTAAIDISGTAAIASDVVGAACVSEAELTFDPATEAEMTAHAGAPDAHREHATLEESAEIDTDVATHAGLPNVHHTQTVDTDTVLTEAQVETFVTNGTLDMGSNPITNIGSAGTDFSATGGLTVGDDLRIDGDLGIGTDPLPGTERNIYMYDGGIYSDPSLYISGHNSSVIKLERRRTDSSIYWLRAGCGSVNCGNDFGITHSTAGTCIAIRDGCDVDIPKLEVDRFKSNPTDSPGTCDAAAEGRFYYDDSLAEPCFCNGSSWTQFDGGGAC